MHAKLPNLKFVPPRHANQYKACIELDGKAVHRVNNLNEFYATFGFTPAMAKAGILPEEFIWLEYIKNDAGNFTACLQMHLIRYLLANSSLFQMQYGQYCEQWFAAHVEMRVANKTTCAGCKFRTFCEDVEDGPTDQPG